MYRKRRTKDIRHPPVQEPAQGTEAAARLPQRIGESASGLFKDLFELPSPKAATEALTSININNTKAGSSSNSTGMDESSLAFRYSSQCGETTLDPSRSFRSNEKGGTIGRIYGQVAFDEFSAGPNEKEHEPCFAQDRSGISGEQQGGFSMGTTKDDQHQVQKRETWTVQDESQDVTDRSNDGAAVVALLLDPASAANEEPSSTLDTGTSGGEGRSYERLQMGKGLAKFVDIVHLRNPLDLMPDFGAPRDPSHAFSATQKDIDENYVLESNFGEIQPWIDILERYHGEVWGEMLPLVEEDREELKAESEKQTDLQDGHAIRRLTMVLQHLGSPKNG